MDGGRAGFRPLLKFAARAGSALQCAFDDLWVTLLPYDCRVCNEPLVRSTALPICDACRAAMPVQTAALCRICGEALDMESVRVVPAEGLLCHVCRVVAPMFERAVASSVYQNEVREMVHLLKYERMSGVAKLMGGQLAKAMLSLRQETADDLLVIPVPLFPSKERERGYNQSELLAAAAIAELRMVAPDWKLRLTSGVLTRQRDTRSQFELNPTGRRRNLAGAFAVDSERLRVGREVILIDDIYTTGATARECAKVLRRAGVAKVWVATLARAQTPSVAMWDGGSQRAPQGFG
jgi:ComF family protein